MSDPLLLERLQGALATRYRVERELASGGMGVVFLAHDLELDRPVAVKILKPELAIAPLVARFITESRLLAQLRHPNVVPIHQAGEADGLFYYVMDFVDGETLSHRLRRQRLTVAETLKLGRDLLDGLEAAHAIGIIHRDIKPSNIFVLSNRAILGDFGIAKSLVSQGDAPTIPGAAVGTPGYMAPEQAAGRQITVQTDFYAVGVVLFEAVTGSSWRAGDADWGAVPRSLGGVLRRALARKPEDRWPDARTFRRALWQMRTRRYVRRTVLLTLSGIVVGLTAGRAWSGTPASWGSPGAVPVSIPAFAYVGPQSERWISDSLVRLVRTELQRHPDFQVRNLSRWLWGARGLELTGRVEVGEREVTAALMNRQPDPPENIPVAPAHAPRSGWTVLADSLAYRILVSVWDSRSPLAAWLPLRTLPRTTGGLGHFLEGEKLLADARWTRAYHAYLVAESTDSTCWLCSWRINEVERWLGQEHDPARTRRYLAHVDSFPPWYQSLIRAGQLPLEQRLDTLHGVTERSREFFLGWFQEGDELFHRGPLIGYPRSRAIAPLETAARLRPDFVPAWEHLAWLYIAERDSLNAVRALAALDRRGAPDDPFSRALRALLDLAFAWQFLPGEVAAVHTARVVSDPTIRADHDFAAGARLLMAFDAPRGAIGMGQLLAEAEGSDIRRSGMLAGVIGAVAIGRADLRRELGKRLLDHSPDAEVRLFLAELDGALALFEPASDPVAALHALDPFLTAGAVPGALRARALWMASLLARRFEPGKPRPDDAALGRSPEARPLALSLRADSMAGLGEFAKALAILDPIEVDSAARHVDPFFRTVIRLERARWRTALGQMEAARAELRWYQHDDLVGLPSGFPQAAEIDWAFGTLARWRLAQGFDESRDRTEQCSAYRGVARHWSGAESFLAARADTALQRMGGLGCSDLK